MFWLLLDSGLMADPCNYPSEIDTDGRMFGGEHLGSSLRSPERRGESRIRPLCPIPPYAQKVAAPPRYVIRIPSFDPESNKSLHFLWWAMLGSNQRPLPCEDSALPLS